MSLSDDDGGHIPDPCAVLTAQSQEHRLLRLEEEFAWMKRNCFGNKAREPPSSPPLQHSHHSRSTRDMEGLPSSSSAEDCRHAVPSSPLENEREGRIHYELRQIAPHLSPEFDCCERDAMLLVSAIRNGSTAGRAESWEERLAASEAEKRMIQDRLERKSDECDNFKSVIAELKERLRVAQEEGQASVSALSQRREQVRKQLLLEESRTQKLQVRNKQLEIELERLKSMLHSQMRK